MIKSIIAASPPAALSQEEARLLQAWRNMDTPSRGDLLDCAENRAITRPRWRPPVLHLVPGDSQ